MPVVTERLWKEKTDVRCERLDRDIVIGITGDETIGDHVLLHLGHMIFGQFLVWGPLVIRCVPDEDAQALYLKGENDADH